MGEAARKAAVAEMPLDFTAQHVGMLDVAVPEEMNLNWLMPLLEQNKSTLPADAQEGMGFMLGMMTPIFQEAMKPFADAKQLTGGLQVVPGGHRVVDYRHEFDQASKASAAAAVFNEEQKPLGKIGAAVIRAKKSVMRSKAVAEDAAVTARVLWPKEDDAKVMDAFQGKLLRTLAGNAGGGMKPSPEPVPTSQIVPPLEFVQPYDPEKLGAEVEAELTNYFWLSNGQYYKEKDVFNQYLQVDKLYVANAFLLKAEFETLSLVTLEGTDVVRKFDRRHSMTFVEGRSITLPDKGKEPKLKHAEVEFYLQVPEWIEVVNIPMGTPTGEDFKSDRVTLFLEQLSNDVASVALEDENMRLVAMEALDSEGNNLGNAGRSWSKNSQSKRFHGTIKTLRVYVAGPAKERVFKRTIPLERNREADAKRVRFAKEVPPKFLNVTAADFDGLEVVHKKSHPESAGSIEVNFPKAPVDYKASATQFGFGKDGPIEVQSRRPQSRKYDKIYCGLPQDLREAGVIFGEIKMTAPESTTYLEVKKTADGESVPFEAFGEKGSVTFDKRSVKINSPKGYAFKVSAAKDHQGRPLHSSGRSYYGEPESVLIYGSSGSFDRSFPFEFEVGDYDKADFAVYKEEIISRNQVLNALESFAKVKRNRFNSPETCSEGIAGLHFLHDEDGKPQEQIPLEIAQADPLMAERFGYTAKPYHGYYFYLCDSEEADPDASPLFDIGEEKKPDGSLNLRMGQEVEHVWKGGSFKAPLMNIHSVNAVPVKEGMPSYHVRLVYKAIYSKVNGTKPNRLAPHTFSNDSWEQVRRFD